MEQRSRCAPSPNGSRVYPTSATLSTELGQARVQRGGGWGEGVRNLSRDLSPSPHPSPYGRGSRPSTPLRKRPSAIAPSLIALALWSAQSPPATAQPAPPTPQQV